ncbi:NXPE family member 3-like [Branchiostoma floridae]|uniref:NXPE family member 3-like n=1 Tax=Branchiostoma floridae TaxID=7739 RepID=A0A9J7LID1_BRAFL|nr:NXPE family member 3-like [Branchiostoma floridae]
MYGGDYLVAVLRDKAQSASTMGRVQDHGNGLYTVSFLLSFPGKVTPEVQLIHPSEAVQLLRELREVPSKRSWSCVFTGETENVKAKCTLLASRSLELSSQCDFSVLNTSRTWFCAKSNATSCDSITKCKSSLDTVDEVTTTAERQLFQRPFFRMDLLADTKIPINVLYSQENATAKRSLPFCHPRLQNSEYQGFRLRGTWHSLSCKVRQFSPLDITKCLANRTVHFRGDSTCRQWIERIGQLKTMHLEYGDLYFKNYTNYRSKIMATFKFHTVPIQSSFWWTFENLSDTGVSNDIMKMIGGENVVLVLSLCSHFTAEPTHVYASRMFEVRSAIEKLQKKYPKTMVIVKSCNTRNQRHYREVVQMSDWLADQLNQEMRSILGSLNVAILDVWDMTVSQWYPYNIHPHRHVVENELNILLSYICPLMTENV